MKHEKKINIFKKGVECAQFIIHKGVGSRLVFAVHADLEYFQYYHGATDFSQKYIYIYYCLSIHDIT